MGGIIGRYALAWMEQNSMEHDTRLLLTFDTPQTAMCRWACKEWIAFFSGYNADAGFFLDALDITGNASIARLPPPVRARSDARRTSRPDVC